jgi:Trypsin-like peptidase domain
MKTIERFLTVLFSQVILTNCFLDSAISQQIDDVEYQKNASYVKSILVNAVRSRMEEIVPVEGEGNMFLNIGYAVLLPSSERGKPDYFLTNEHVYAKALGKQAKAVDRPPIIVWINQNIGGTRINCNLQVEPIDIAYSQKPTERGESDFVILAPTPNSSFNRDCESKWQNTKIIFPKINWGDSVLLKEGDLVYAGGNADKGKVTIPDLENFSLFKMKITATYSSKYEDLSSLPSLGFYEYSPIETNKNLESGDSGGAVVDASSTLMGIHAGSVKDGGNVRRMVPSSFICQRFGKHCANKPIQKLLPAQKPFLPSLNSEKKSEGIVPTKNEKFLILPQLW